MSETGYFHEIALSMAASHPLKEGWSIYRIDRSYLKGCVQHLPAFLRVSASGAVEREAIWSPGLDWSDGKDGMRQSLKELPSRRRGSGLTEWDWSGEIDFVWEGSSLHFRRLLTRHTYGERMVTFVAAKERKAIESLWRALRAYCKKISSPRTSIILVDGESIPRPKADWDELILPGTMREEIRSGAESFLMAKKKYKDLKLPYRRGFLFAGPPGCGKTLAVRIIAARAKATVFNLALQSGLKEEDVSGIFRSAQESAPAFLILEDLDRLSGSSKVSLSFLLNLLDGLVATEGVLILATTNHPENLDPALIHRPSRFDKIWHFPLPGFEERLILTQRRAMGKFSESAVEDAARQSQGFTMAYVQEGVVNALLQALHEGREPRDTDLLDSVRRLKEQFSAGFKADGALRPTKGVGFGAA